jgi:hypothetical protein
MFRGQLHCNRGTVFSTRSVPRCYSQWSTVVGVRARESRVKAGSNTSTVALRVVGGDEKGTQCYNWATLFSGAYKYWDLALQFGAVSNLRE